MLDETDFEYMPPEMQKQGQRTLEIPTDAIDQSDSIALELETGATEGKIVLGRNSRCVSVCLWTHSRLLPKVAEKKECLRGRKNSLSFDVPSTKRNY